VSAVGDGVIYIKAVGHICGERAAEELLFDLTASCPGGDELFRFMEFFDSSSSDADTAFLLAFALPPTTPPKKHSIGPQ
jgi:hypothetical protein